MGSWFISRRKFWFSQDTNNDMFTQCNCWCIQSCNQLHVCVHHATVSTAGHVDDGFMFYVKTYWLMFLPLEISWYCVASRSFDDRHNEQCGGPVTTSFCCEVALMQTTSATTHLTGPMSRTASVSQPVCIHQAACSSTVRAIHISVGFVLCIWP